MTLSEENTDDEMEYYTYSVTVTRPSLYGWAGTYREEYNPSINCLEYALLLEEDACLGISTGLLYPRLNSEAFIGSIIREIQDEANIPCRKIESYDDPINYGEYRIAARVPNADGYQYHFIYQLSDGTWAGKDNQARSEHFGTGNPDNSPEMWANDRYSPAAGTIYFAVKRWG